MKRASYRYGIAWVAMNDSAGDDNRLEPDEVGYLVSSLLIADLFDVPPERVGADIVRYRKKEDRERSKT